MRYIKLSLVAICITCSIAFVACSKKTTDNTTVVNGDARTATGTLEQLGATTFMYGTHRLNVNSTTWYLLESTALNLDQYTGATVTITAVNTHYHAEQGPEMYNVTSVTRH